MLYINFTDLPKRKKSDKALHGKRFNIAKNPKYDEYQRGLAWIVYEFFEFLWKLRWYFYSHMNMS